MAGFLSILVPILFIIAGFLVLRGRGITGRKWFFISLLAILYVMMSAYGAEWVVGAYYPQASTDAYYGYGTYYPSTYTQFTYGLVLLSFGILGYVLVVMFRGKNEELSITFGLAGSILVVTGLIELMVYQNMQAKFILVAVGVVVVSYLIYRYRSFLMGD